jgi:hypothetical protein
MPSPTQVQVGQLWRSLGSVWRVVGVDPTKVDPYERVVLEIHESSRERDMHIAGLLEVERSMAQLATGDFAYPPLTPESFDRMTVELPWFAQPMRKLVGEAA